MRSCLPEGQLRLAVSPGNQLVCGLGDCSSSNANESRMLSPCGCIPRTGGISPRLLLLHCLVVEVLGA